MLAPFEALNEALEAVWSGADEIATQAVLDQLDDRGYRVTPSRRAVREPQLFDQEVA